MKTTQLVIRISEHDKEALRELAEKKSMTMSELLTYMIRREIEKEGS